MGFHEEQWIFKGSTLRRDDIKYFRDPIHGYIKIPQPELDIVNHPLFQRLRNIKQLGLTYYVFHGAEHTRFGHSLGTMDITNSILRVLGIDDNEIKNKISLAALLHDIGHSPLSHALEPCINGGHEEYTKNILRNTSIKDVLMDYGYSLRDIEEIIGYILGHHIKFPLGAQIIHSELDADRLDYLLRDSIFCGVKYGIYDLERLLISLKLHNNHLLVSQKGIYAAEGFILARYHMYVQVYTHKTKCGFEIIAREIFKRLIEDSIIEYPPPDSDNLEEEILNKDDIWFFSQIRKVLKNEDINNFLKKLIKMLLYREPLKLVDEERAYYSSDERYVSEKFTLLQHLKEWKPIIEKFSERGISENEVFVDVPSMELKQKPYYLRETEEYEGEPFPILVLSPDNEIIDIAKMRNSPIRDIAAKRLEIVRIYTFREKEDIVRRVLNEGV